MSNFTWVPVFKGLAKWLSEHEDDQRALIEVLSKIGIDKGLEDINENRDKVPLLELDPFTFFCLFTKFGAKKRRQLFEKLIAEKKLDLQVPIDFDGVPTAQAVKAWLFPYQHDRQASDVPTLWKLFKEGLEGHVQDKTFANALRVKNTGFAKVTECLFYIDPDNYFPVNRKTAPWLEKHGYELKARTWEAYSELLATIRTNHTEPFYKISFDAYVANQENPFTADTAIAYLDERYPSTIQQSKKIVAFTTNEGRELAFSKGENSSVKTWISLFVDSDPAVLGLKTKHYEPGTGRSSNFKQHAKSLADGNRAYSMKVSSEKELAKVCDWYEELTGQVAEPTPAYNSSTNHERSPSVMDNIILYGPPGTGKTYQTTERAVQSADPRFYDQLLKTTDSDELRNAICLRYRELLDEQRIVFTTFHQSYSYEDFIEGIRAITDESTGQLSYEVTDGVFKQLCQNAEASVQSVAEESVDVSDQRIWKMSLGNTLGDEADIYDECLEDGYVLLGWGERIDFSDCDTTAKIKARYEQKRLEKDLNLTYAVSAVNMIRNQMAVGDLIIVTDGNHKFRAIAEITGDYEFLDSEERLKFQQMRRVKWLRTYFPSLPRERLFKKAISQMTVYQIKDATIERDKLQSLLSAPESKTKETRPHVLIIDEINRGNIARIFGELITLLEVDKRKGADDEKSTILPYSKTPFSVPSNVQIIGTMNTADKSLAQLDLALRRRFKFEEVMPSPELLDGINVYDVNMAELLSILNARIEVLLDRDHMIGHSYFLPLSKTEIEEEREAILGDIFKNRIVPLLQEYFFADWERIAWVLNDIDKARDDQFIVPSKSFPSLSTFFSPKVVEELQDRRYAINHTAFNNPKSYQGIMVQPQAQ